MKTTYLALLNFTERGVRALGESPHRAQEWRRTIESRGLKVLTQLWTAGAYDGVIIIQGDNEQEVLGALTELATLGNVRTHSLRAFDADEFARIVGASEK